VLRPSCFAHFSCSFCKLQCPHICTLFLWVGPLCSGRSACACALQHFFLQLAAYFSVTHLLCFSAPHFLSPGIWAGPSCSGRRALLISAVLLHPAAHFATCSGWARCAPAVVLCALQLLILQSCGFVDCSFVTGLARCAQAVVKCCISVICVRACKFQFWSLLCQGT
jgi:hypothetical protein